MRLQVSGINHQGVTLPPFCGKFSLNAGEDPQPAPAHPTIVKRLRRAIGIGRIPPAQPVATDEDYPAQHLPVVDPRLAMRQREKWFETLHLRLRQPQQIAHAARPYCLQRFRRMPIWQAIQKVLTLGGARP